MSDRSDRSLEYAMPLFVRNGRFSLHEAPMLLPVEGPVDGGPEDAVRAWGHPLVSELRRVGWDVPELDVKVSKRGRGRTVYRAVEEVSGLHEGRRFRFDVRFWAAQGDVVRGGNVARITGLSEVCVSDELGHMVRATPEVALDILGGAMAILSRYPDAEEPDAALEEAFRVDRIPAPEDFPVLYVWEERIKAAHAVGEGGTKDDDWLVAGEGWRCCGSPPSEGRVLDRANGGFSYAGTDLESRTGHVRMGVNADALPVEVRLKWLNDVFVLDRGAYLREMDRLEGEAAAAGGRVSDREMEACVTAAALTMVEAAGYDGSFDSPVYLIGRQLARDEARLMRGRVMAEGGIAGAKVSVRDEATGARFSVWRRPTSSRAEAAQCANEAEHVRAIYAAADRDATAHGSAPTEREQAFAFQAR